MALWANVHGGFPIGLFLIGAFVARDARSMSLPGSHAHALMPEGCSHGSRGQGTCPCHPRSPLALPALPDRSVCATLLNPYGVGIYEYVFTLSRVASGRQIEEWLPPSMGLWVGRAWLASVARADRAARRRPAPAAGARRVRRAVLPAAGVRVGADGAVVAADASRR